jgi:hypothetical protein
LVRHAHSPNQSLLDKVALAIQRAVDELTASASI